MKILVEKEVPDGWYCGGCHWAMPKETAQIKKKEQHFCYLFDKKRDYSGIQSELTKLLECKASPTKL